MIEPTPKPQAEEAEPPSSKSSPESPKTFIKRNPLQLAAIVLVLFYVYSVLRRSNLASVQQYGSFVQLASAASTSGAQPEASKSDLSPAARFGGNSIWTDLDGWRRNKRDIEDRIVLASRRAATKQAGSGKAGDEEFEVDDGNEDAWVHDGVDDIHIDPETKRAASELSKDEGSSIDSEYEPNNGAGGGQESDSQPVVNGTRITTIQEVIPVSTDELESPSGGGDGRVQMMGSAASAHRSGPLLPASYLTLAQVQQLIDSQRRRGDEDEEETPSRADDEDQAASGSDNYADNDDR